MLVLLILQPAPAVCPGAMALALVLSGRRKQLSMVTLSEVSAAMRVTALEVTISKWWNSTRESSTIAAMWNRFPELIVPVIVTESDPEP